jgi:hypothetical protein
MIALAGHISRATVERYSQVRMAAKREAVETRRLNPKSSQKPKSDGGTRESTRVERPPPIQ